MDARQDERLVELEIRYTHLERQVEELNGVVVAQQRTIDDLTKRLTMMASQVVELGEPPRNEPPPHY